MITAKGCSKKAKGAYRLRFVASFFIKKGLEMSLKTDYKDDIFAGNRKYEQTTNDDGTISFEDVTDYTQEGDVFSSTDINETNEKVNDIEDELPTVTGVYTPYSSEYITSKESSLGIIDDMVVEGKTYQNLARLDLDASELFGDFSGNLANGEITLDGDGINYKNAFYNYNISMYKPNTQYTLVLDIAENSLTRGGNVLIAGETNPTGVFKELMLFPENIGCFKYLVESDYEFTSSPQAVLRSYLLSSETGSITYSFMILEGDYTNVDLPSTITGIESVSSPVIKSVGKNILDFTGASMYGNNGIITTHTDDGLGYIMNGTATDDTINIWFFGEYNRNPILQPEYALFKIKRGLTIRPVGCHVFWYKPSTNYAVAQIHSGEILTAPEDIIITGVRCVTVISGQTYTNEVIYPAIIVGDSETRTYEPYQESSVSLDIGDMPSLPDGTKDYVSWKDGGWWECVGEYTFSGSDENSWINDTGATDYSYWWCSKSQDISCVNLWNRGIASINNKFLSPYLVATEDLSNIKTCGVAYTNQVVITLPLGTVSTSDELNTFLGTDDITIYYPLKTPIFHPLPLETLKSFSGTTHVFSEGSNVEPNISCRILENAPEVISVTQEAIMKVEEKLQTENDNQIDKSDIVDNLSTDDATKVLSAKQGKALNDAKAPNSHASTATTYGVASTTNYGHVKYGNAEGTACQGNDSRLSNSRTPNAHASSGTTYGKGDASNYGHIKLSDSHTSTSDANGGISATPKAVKDAYDLATAANNNANNRIAKTQFSLSGTTLTITL